MYSLLIRLHVFAWNQWIFNLDLTLIVAIKLNELRKNCMNKEQQQTLSWSHEIELKLIFQFFQSFQEGSDSQKTLVLCNGDELETEMNPRERIEHEIWIISNVISNRLISPYFLFISHFTVSISKMNHNELMTIELVGLVSDDLIWQFCTGICCGSTGWC